MMHQIVPQQLRNVLINGKFPSETVKVKGVSFEFTFTDDDILLCNTVTDYVEFLSRVVKCSVRDYIVPLTNLPSSYFYPVQAAYVEFQYTTLRTLLEAVAKFTESSESRGLWLAYKHSDPSYVLSIDHKLNLIQRRWIVLNAVNDTKDNMEMVTDIFEVAKPWLDKDLYTKIKDQADATRENAFFDDVSQDAKLREKAKRVAAAQQKGNTEPEGDIIIMEEEEG